MNKKKTLEERGKEIERVKFEEKVEMAKNMNDVFVGLDCLALDMSTEIERAMGYILEEIEESKNIEKVLEIIKYFCIIESEFKSMIQQYEKSNSHHIEILTIQEVKQKAFDRIGSLMYDEKEVMGFGDYEFLYKKHKTKEERLQEIERFAETMKKTEDECDEIPF